MKQRMDHADYCEKCSGMGRAPMAKADYDDLDEADYEKATEGIDDEEPDEDEDDEDEEKSLSLSPDEEELAKSMEYLTAMADSAMTGPQDRLAELSARAAAYGLEKSEKAELMALLSDDYEPTRASDDLMKSETSQEAFEASAFLEAVAGTMAKSLDGLASEIQVDRETQGEFNRRLARGLDALAKSLFSERRKTEALQKSQNELLARLSGQPVPWAGKVHLSPADLDKSGRASSADLDVLRKSSGISRKQAQSVVSSLFSRAVEEEKEGLQKSLANVLSNLSVTAGDWRQVQGMTPDLIENVTRTVAAG